MIASGILVLVLALVASGCGGDSDESSSAGESGATEVKVVYANQAANFTPLFVAVGEGIFADNGLDVSTVLGEGPQVLQSGDAQFALDSGEPMLTAIAAGADMSLVGATGNRFGFVLLARKPIDSVEDLRGKKLALSSPTGAVGTAGKELLKRYDLEGEVEIAYIEDISARLAALNEGSIDAIILSPPVRQLMATGEINQVLDLRKDFHFLLVGIWGMTDYVNDNPETVTAFLKSMNEAITFMKDPANKEATLGYIEEATGFQEVSEQEEAYEYEILRYPETVEIDMEALQASIDFLKGQGDFTAPEPDSFMERGPLDSLNGS